MAEASRRKQQRPARPKSLKERRARGRALVIFYISAFSAVVVSAILLCIFVFFKVGTVQLTGNAGYREEDILSVCAIQEGDNLVLLSTRDREAELEHRFPYIESAKIVKHIPSTVEIVVEAAKTSFSVESESGYLYVSGSGKILEIEPEPCPKSAVVLGCTPTTTVLSEQIGFEEETAQEVLKEIASQLRENGVTLVTEIDLRNPYDVTMTYDGRIKFLFGNTNDIAEKMTFGMKMLNQMLDSGEITPEMQGEIDLTLVTEKKAGYFREIVGGVAAAENTEGVAGREPTSENTDTTGGDDGDENEDDE